MKKDPTPRPYTPPDPDDNSAVVVTTLEQEVSNALDPERLSRIKKIVYYISKVGFSYEEACALANVDYEALKADMKTYPVIAKLLQIKELQYKKDLLLTITKQATTEGDDKLALWLLERKYPNEFGTKKPASDQNDNDMLLEAVQYIQKSGDNEPLIGKAIKITKKTDDQNLIQKVANILT